MSSTAHDELAAAVREWLAAEDDWALGTGRGHPPEVESERAQCALSKAGRVLDVLRTHHPLRPESEVRAEGYRAGLEDAERKCREACARWVETFRVAIGDALDGRLPSASNDGAVAANECADAIRALTLLTATPAPALDVGDCTTCGAYEPPTRAKCAYGVEVAGPGHTCCEYEEWRAAREGGEHE